MTTTLTSATDYMGRTVYRVDVDGIQVGTVYRAETGSRWGVRIADSFQDVWTNSGRRRIRHERPLYGTRAKAVAYLERLAAHAAR